MFFLLECDNKELEIEYFLWKQLLNDSKDLHQYVECKMSDLDSICHTLPSGVIPLGSIPFTNMVLQQIYGISQMNPIEIPVRLRTSMFLGREYRIVHPNQIPTEGQYFVKDASAFKTMHYFGDMKHFDRALLVPDHLYVVSEAVDILSEYRVYVIRGEVYAIEYYNGDPLVLPDVKQIQIANRLYSIEKDYPNSYTIDVMVTPTGTFLTEIHPVLFAVGLYTTVLSTDFLYGYRDGLDYVLKHNTPVVATF